MFLGCAWFAILLTRSMWDFINFAFISYAAGKRQWSKSAYTWMLNHHELFNCLLAFLNCSKLCFTTVAFCFNLLRWCQILRSDSTTMKRTIFAIIGTDVSFAMITIVLTLIFGSPNGGAALYNGYAQFIAKPLIIALYIVTYIKAKTFINDRSLISHSPRFSSEG